MSDRDEIIEAINMYAWAIDSKQFELFADVFTDDVQADHVGLQWTSLSDYIRDMADLHAKYDITQHLIGNHQIHVAGDTASCRSYARAIRISHPDAGGAGESRLSIGASYDDELIRTDAGWRIKRRTARSQWTEASQHRFG
jgi:hypothetical protein